MNLSLFESVEDYSYGRFIHRIVVFPPAFAIQTARSVFSFSKQLLAEISNKVCRDTKPRSSRTTIEEEEGGGGGSHER